MSICCGKCGKAFNNIYLDVLCRDCGDPVYSGFSDRLYALIDCYSDQELEYLLSTDLLDLGQYIEEQLDARKSMEQREAPVLSGYLCDCCGRHFEKPEYYEESLGEYWGYPAAEKTSGCPYCGGSFEEEDNDNL